MDTIKLKEPNGIELDKWIKKVEEEIAYEMTELNMLVTPLKEAEEKYERAKIEYERVKKDYGKKLEEIERDKDFKDMLVRKREGYMPKKKIMQLTATSATAKVPKKSKKQPKKEQQAGWKEWTLEILETNDKFMAPHDLFDTILHLHPDNFSNKRQISKDRWSYVNMLLPGYHKISVLAGQPRASGRIIKDKGVIIRYDAGETKALKYGLRDWVDDQFIPFAKYMREFMFDDKVEDKVRKIS